MDTDQLQDDIMSINVLLIMILILIIKSDEIHNL